MEIGIVGATGNDGRADVPVLACDAFDLTAEDLGAFDVVVNAFATAPNHARRHVDLARELVELTRSHE